ncbi:MULTISPECIES: diaminobutyrate--2-oxoglutarate transaminase [unclassified Bradyrhizobium]|uniref:diaminobutyrate--2-oxoglutarate transaminase n=1 Tax=Bradyrhizobium sp. USDA 4541 TaxID=2817704 RepID=UPI0020A2AA0E|nr:diaminobutyrate--2-oxoglutarate transaminase [Bradyrhizobium sp. USDA 4541]MCP1854517.1 diaminobutyrate-2-oxoglutarate transaminase [Bradyrhizobium sp. USDA 4541]
MNYLADFAGSESEVRYYCRQIPNLFATARGACLWDAEGTEFIDFLAGCGSLNYGHNHPKIKAALQDYLQADGIGCALDLHTGAKLAFIRAFRDLILSPRGMNYRMQFTGPTGANAVEAALKLARKHTGRTNVVAFTNAFHGMSLGALSATGSNRAREGLQGCLDGVVRLPFDGYHGAGQSDLERFAAMAEDPSGGIDPVAAIIVETVQGEGGLNVASRDWLRHLRDVARRIGALLIVDDIQAGCGRSGRFFSFEDAGIAPDMVCLAKSISGGGLPMSLLLINPSIDTWRPGEHNGTFRGNNLAFVTARAALELWSDSDFIAGIAVRSTMLDRWLTEVCVRYPHTITNKKGLGMMVGFECSSPELARAISQEAFKRHLVLEVCGPRDEVVKILAPLNIELSLFREGLARLAAALDVVALEQANRADLAA